jgi:hypothetical protein
VTLPVFSESAKARSIGPSKSLRDEIGAAISNLLSRRESHPGGFGKSTGESAF